MKKKICIMLLISSFLINNSVLKVFANNKDLLGVERILIKNMISDDIEVKDVKIAKPINILNTDTYMYPIFNNNEIVKFIEVTPNKEGEEYISIGDFNEKEINKLGYNDTIIYQDLDGVKYAINKIGERVNLDNGITEKELYILNDTEKTLFHEKGIEPDNIIYDIDEIDLIKQFHLAKNGSWNYNYPSVRQSGKNSCWAASMSSILRGKGYHYSETDVLNTVNKSSNETSTSDDVKRYFNNYFGLGGNINYRHNKQTLINDIGRGNAIWQAMFDSFKGGHSVVVYGYEEQNGNLWVSLMDPQDGNRYDALISSNGRFGHNNRESTEYIYNIRYLNIE